MNDEERHEIEGQIGQIDSEPASGTTEMSRLVDESESESESIAPLPVRSRHRWLHWYATHKKLSIPLTILLLVVVLAGVTAATDARFAVLNLFGHAKVVVDVRDQKTDQLVPNATVTIGGISTTTNNQGKATVSDVPYGHNSVVVTKNAYAHFKTNLTVTSSTMNETYSLKPVGTPLTLLIKNLLNQQVLSGAKVTSGESDVLADTTGKAVLSVPPQDSDKVLVTVSADGYLSKTVTLSLKSASTAPTNVSLAPAGKVYFLSKQSGTIDVVKTNLDGSDRQTVLAGTGQEDDRQTVLFASRDWRYLALESKRQGDQAALYLIDTTTGKLTNIDTSKAAFTLVGWDGHHFVYEANPNGQNFDTAGANIIKSFDADTSDSTTLDSNKSVALGTDSYGEPQYAYQTFTTPYIDKDGIVYASSWQTSDGSVLSQKYVQQILTIDSDGSNRTTIATYSPATVANIDSKLYEPNSVYFLLSGTKQSIVEVEDGTVKNTSLKADDFYSKTYDTYLLSPSGNKTLWSDPRDGKNAVFVGDGDGQKGKQLYSDSTYVAYGWYGENYVLLSVNSSELYIVGVNGGTPVKISDYHKPSINFNGYGSGYGAF